MGRLLYCVIVLGYLVVILTIAFRILGLRRTPIAVGRTVSLSREVIPVASQELLQTFYEQGMSKEGG